MLKRLPIHGVRLERGKVRIRCGMTFITYHISSETWETIFRRGWLYNILQHEYWLEGFVIWKTFHYHCINNSAIARYYEWGHVISNVFSKWPCGNTVIRSETRKSFGQELNLVLGWKCMSWASSEREKIRIKFWDCFPDVPHMLSATGQVIFSSRMTLWKLFQQNSND